MTTEDGRDGSAHLEKMTANLAKIELLNARLVAALAQRKQQTTAFPQVAATVARCDGFWPQLFQE